MRIAHIAAPAPIGGLERVVEGLAAGQARQGDAVLVIASLAPNAAEPAFLRTIRDAGGEVQVVRVGARGYVAERRAVGRLLDAWRPDVVHTHGYRSDLLHLGVARARGIPIVTTLHGSSLLGGNTTLYEWLQLRVLRRFDAVVAVSRPLQDELARAGVTPSRIHLIPNGFAATVPFLSRGEARAALDEPGDGPCLGWIGRLIPVKACEVFLHALARVPPPVRAVVVGDGTERPRLEGEAARLGLAGRVRFAGHQDRGPALLRAFDALVLSSHSEGTPMTVLEAMAAGVPVVATAVGGVPDAVGGGAGWLVPPADPAALAAAIADCLGDRAAAMRRAAAARGRLEEVYGTEQWLGAHRALYADPAGRGTSAPLAAVAALRD